MPLLAELKRRNVIRMAGLYLVGAWLLVQVAETVLPAFDVPGWVLRAIILVLALGFVPALVFAWIFELTPEGLKRDGVVAPEDSITPVTGRRMDRMIVVGLVAVIALMAIERFWHAPAAPAVADNTTAAASPAPAATTPTPAAVSDKSIAVLPFENLSSDPDNAYFATGMQDEILTRLSKIHDLRVISRTSTMNIASKPANLPEIAAMLGVSAILEGSVQRSGDAVHVNVQLIRAATDEHLWAESYNRKLDDVFAVQSEVAQAVAEALDAALTGAERAAVSAQPTSNTKAYEYYLRGLALEARYTNATPDLEARAAAYRKAVEHDPKFALAWAGLSTVLTEIWFNERTPVRRASVEEALAQAQALAPDTSETWAATAIYRYFVERDYDDAFAAYAKALETRPNDGLIVYSMGNVRRRQGRWDEALALQARGTEMDPLATNTWYNYGLTLRALRRYDEAQAAFDRGLAAVPGDAELVSQKINTFVAAGDLAAAEAYGRTLSAQEKSPPIVHNDLATLHVLRRDYPAAIAELQAQLALRGTMSPEGLRDTLITLGMTEHLAGDKAAAAIHLGEFRDSLLALRAQGNVNPYLTRLLARASAVLGDREAAYRLADESAADLASDALGLPSAIETQAYVRMLGGDRAEAVELLRQALALPAAAVPTAAWLRLDPAWDPLRDEPGFAELLVEHPVASP